MFFLESFRTLFRQDSPLHVLHVEYLWDKDDVCLIFAARNNAADVKEEQTDDSGSEESEIDAIEYNDDDEIDELEEVMKQLEPKYRRYANWRI